MVAEQRAQMAVDQLVGNGVLLALSGDQQGAARADGDGEQDRGGISEPARCRPRSARARCRLPPERKANLRTQRLRRAIDRSRLSNAVTQVLERRRLGAAFRTIGEMVAQLPPLGLGELAVDIGLEPRTNLVTLHY